MIANKRLFVVLAIGAAAFALWYSGVSEHLSLAELKENRDLLLSEFRLNPLKILAVYLALYLVVTALSVPGATILTLAGGAIFGFKVGLVVVSIASTAGATLAFLASRYLLRSTVQRRYQNQLKRVNEEIVKAGGFYLFSLRLVPLFPFFLVNLLVGLTPISLRTYVAASWIGMLPGTAAYVYAGTEIGKINDLGDVLSPSLVAAFIILALLPWISKWCLGRIRSWWILRRFPRPKRFDYNLIVIGAGSAGLVSAYIGAAARARVLLIERGAMGGDCLNTGCVPSKSIIKSAKVASLISRGAEFGIEGADATANFTAVMKRVKSSINKIEPHDSIERYQSLGVDCEIGEAKLISPFEVEVNAKRFTTRSIILATGGKPRIPKLDGALEVPHCTSDSIWELTELPKRFLVLGGGPIGCELAQTFSRLGSKVTQIDRGNHLLHREDPEVGELIAQKFRAEGITVLTGSTPKYFKKSGSGGVLICDSEVGAQEIEFDLVLYAVGRVSTLSVSGTAELGITLNENGGLNCDEHLRSVIPNIFGCGDLVGPYQLTHFSAHQAWFAAMNALFGGFKLFRADYRVVPRCTFTDPEVAVVGVNEAEAERLGYRYEKTVFDLAELDRAIVEGEDVGFIKVLTAPGSDKILGATIVGHSAGEILAEYTLAMKHGLGLNKILRTIHPYPTFSEANKFVAGKWKRSHAPTRLLELVEGLHRFLRR